MNAILTYDAPHRKTQDLLFRMAAAGRKDIQVVATPWAERKNFVPIFYHRPPNNNDTPLETLCRNLGFPFIRSPHEELVSRLNDMEVEYLMIAGAGIVPGEIAENFRTVNVHPGYLPYVKGLDALKWAILEGLPIGVTSHFISGAVDEGTLIRQERVPLYYEDSFHSLATRQYELEIKMLAEAEADIAALQTEINLANDTYKAHRRMTHQLEVKMMDKFHELRRNSPSHREAE
ncbi:MAG: formyltransferase family protein [Bacteroidota bacterium]